MVENQNKRNKKKQSRIAQEIDFELLEQELIKKNKKNRRKVKKYDNKRF